MWAGAVPGTDWGRPPGPGRQGRPLLRAALWGWRVPRGEGLTVPAKGQGEEVLAGDGGLLRPLGL